MAEIMPCCSRLGFRPNSESSGTMIMFYPCSRKWAICKRGMTHTPNKEPCLKVSRFAPAPNLARRKSRGVQNRRDSLIVTDVGRYAMAQDHRAVLWQPPNANAAGAGGVRR